MGVRFHSAFYVALALLSHTCLLEAGTPSRQAMVVDTCEATFDGKKVMDVPAGTKVIILGAREDGAGRILVRIPTADLGEKTALIPASATVPLSEEQASHAGRISPQQGEPAQPAFDPNRESAAEKLAEFFKSNRENFGEWEGKSLTVSGVVESVRVTSKTGSMPTAEITLKTRPDLPKFRLLVHASEFMDSDKSDRPELRVQGETLEARSRDRKRAYKYWYYYNGYWRWRSDSKTEWVPIISVGQPLKANGVLSKYHIHLELDGATIDKG